MVDQRGQALPRFAIGASLADPLGTSRSHGCIRVDNTDIVWLAQVLPVGTPVDIK